MSLKTATLIALIGVALHFGFHLLRILGVFRINRFYYLIFPMIFFYGSLILFFAVFYSKQKE
jgi:hypothetical protein